MNPEILNNKPNEEKWLSMSEASVHTPYSSEYLSLLARKGKLTAKKIDNTWYTTLAILDDYMKRQMLRAQVQNGNFASIPAVVEVPKVLPISEPIKPVRSYHEDIQEYLKEFKGPQTQKEAEVFTKPPQVVDKSFVESFFGNIFGSLAFGKNIIAGVFNKKNTAQSILTQSNSLPPFELKSVVDTTAVELALEKVLDKRFSSINSSTAPKTNLSKPIRTVFSSKLLVGAAIVCVLIFTIFPIPVVFSMFEKSYDYVKTNLKDSNTVLGFRPGTHANEILLLDKSGNISIMGHIETEGQFRSYAPDGTAPIVVDSKTLVKNLNAEYLGGASSTDFTLAFITKNGAVTTQDVNFQGNVEVGKTLLVRGATKLLSSLRVDGGVSVFGDAEFNKTLSVVGPAYFQSILSTKGDVLAGGNLTVNRNVSVRGGLEVGTGITARNGSFGSLGVSGQLSANDIYSTNINADNASTTNFFTTNFNAAVSNLNSIISNSISVGALTSTNLTATNATTTNLIATNSTTTNATSTNIFATNGNFTNLTFGGSVVTNSTTTNATSTNLFSTNIFGNNANFLNLLINGSTTLQDYTFNNATGTNSTTTNFFSTNAVFTNLNATNQTFTNSSATNSTTTNATSTNLFSTNIFGTTGNLTNLLLNGSSTLQNFTFNNGTGTSATTTNFFSNNVFGTNANFTNILFVNATGTSATTTNFFTTTGSTTNLFFTTANGGTQTLSGSLTTGGLGTFGTVLALGSTTLQKFTFTNATGTSATTTNFFATNIFGTNANFLNLLTNGSTTLQNFTFVNGTGTSATTTNFFSNNISSTNQTVTNSQITNSTTTNATSTNLFSTKIFGTIGNLTNLLLNGSSTLQNFTFVNGTGTSATTTNFFATNLFGTNFNFSNLIYTNATGTNSTSTNLFSTNIFGNTAIFGNLLLNGSSTFQNLTFNNATGTNATTTNLSVLGNFGTSLTQGSVPFIGANGVLTENNSRLFWNSATSELGIGTNNPLGILDVSYLAANNTSLVPIMTSNTTPSGVASCSSIFNASTDCYKAFDGLASNGWLNNGGTTGTLGYQFTTGKVAIKYSMTPWSVDSFPARSPKSWTFEGSNDGSSWTVLDTQTNFTGWVSYASQSFPFANSTSYKYFRLNITANGGNAYTALLNFGIYDASLIPSSGLLVNSMGNVGINTYNPTATLDVHGTASSTNLVVNGLSTLQNFTFANGTGTAATTTNFFSTNLSSNFSNIGTTTLSNLTVTNTNSSSFAGSVAVAKSLSVGTNITDTLSVTARINTDLVPDANITRNIGSPALYWNNGYFNTLNVNTISAASTTIAGTQSNDFTINTDNATADTENMNLVFFRGLVTPNAVISWDSLLDKFNLNQPVFIQNQSSSTTIPTLEVKSQIGQTADIFRTTSLAGSVLFNVTNGGNVGIGTTNPQAKLDVLGTASSTNLFVNGSSTLQNFTGLNSTTSNSTSTNFAVSNNLYTSLTQNSIPFIGANGLLTQNNANLNWNNSTNLLTVGGDYYSPNGHISAGAQDSRFWIYSDKTVTADSLNYAIYGTTRLDTTANAITFNQVGSRGSAYFQSGANNVSIASGVVGEVIRGNTASGVLGSAYGVQGTVSNNVAGTISNAYGLYSAFNIPAGSIGTGYGLFIATPTGTRPTTSYGVYQQDSGSSNYFAGSTLFNGSSTLQNFTFVNGTGTSATTTNFYSTNLSSTNLNLTNLTYTNATGTNSTTTNAYISGNLATALTKGSVPFIGASGILSQNNANFFWDNTNARLGIGTSAPVNRTSIVAPAAAGNVVALNINNPYNYGVGNGTAAATLRFNRSPIDAGSTGVMADISGGNETETTSVFGYLAFGTRSGAPETTTERMRITSGGNVGIGTTNPIALLQIETNTGTVTAGTGLYLNKPIRFGAGATSNASYGTYIKNNVNGSSYGNLTFGRNFGGTDADIMTLQGNSTGGNVGIGTSTPGSKLEIYGSGQVLGSGAANITDAGARGDMISLISNNTAAGTGGALLFGNTQSEAVGSVGFAAIKGMLTNGTGNTRGDLAFSTRINGLDTNLTEAMRITNGGNVGIGTTTPGAKLVVSNGSSGAGINPNSTMVLESSISQVFNMISPASLTSSIYFGDPAGASRGGFDYYNSSNATAADRLDLRTANTVKLSVLSSGNVGIGSTTPGEKLEVAGNIIFPNTNFIKSYNASGVSSALFQVNASNNLMIGDLNNQLNDIRFSVNGSAAGNVTIQRTTGFLGIGTVSPQTALDVNGTASTTNLFVNGSSTLQNFTFSNATGTNATTTNFFSTNFGTTNLYTSLTQGSVVFAGASGMLSQNNSNFFWDNTNNRLGIGTASPFAELHVAQADTANGILFSGTTKAVRIGFNSGATLIEGVDTTGVGSYQPLIVDGSTLDFAISGSKKVSINSSGNVGIGTTTPDDKLVVTSTSGPSAIKINSGSNPSVYSTRLVTNFDANSSFQIFGAFNVELLRQNPNASALSLMPAGGNVGIGTTTPGAKLDIFSTSSTIPDFTTSNIFANKGIRISSNTNVATIQGFTPTTGADNQNLAINPNGGNVGIGTTIPGGKLEVKNSVTGAVGDQNYWIKTSGGNGFTGNVSQIGMGYTTGTGQNTPVTFGARTVDQTGFTTAAFFVATRNTTGSTDVPTERLTVDATGNVGIGTTNPVRVLQVNATTTSSTAFNAANLNTWATMAVRSQVAVQNGATGIVFHTDTNATASPNSGAGIAAIDSQSASWGGKADLAFMTASGNVSAERMRITSLGNVGVGTTTPANKLEIYGANPYIAADASSGNPGLKLLSGSVEKWRIDDITASGDRLRILNAGAATEVMSILQNGNVGIGSTTPGEKLEVAGNIIFPNTNFIKSYNASGVSSALFQVNASNNLMIGDLNNQLNDIRFSVNGSAAGNVTIQRTTGFLGIGTVSPQTALDVNGTASTTNLFVNGSSTLQNFTFVNGTGTSATTTNFFSTNLFTSNFNATNGTFANLIWTNATGTNSTTTSLYVSGRSVLNGAATLGSTLTFPTTAQIIGGSTNGLTIRDSTNTRNNAVFADNGSSLILSTAAQSAYFGTSAATGEVSAGARYETTQTNTGISMVTKQGAGSSVLTLAYYDGSTARSALDVSNVASGFSNLLLMRSGGNVGIGTSSPTSKLSVSGGDVLIDGANSQNVGGLYFQNGTNFASTQEPRNSGLIASIGGLSGRVLNRNPDFLSGDTTGFSLYDNSAGGHTTISVVASSTVPNSSGYTLRVSYDGAGTPGVNPTPGYGGFLPSPYNLCTGGSTEAVNGYCYREGERIMERIWAKIPVGYKIQDASNSIGIGGTRIWTTSQAGTGQWQEYIMIMTTGVGGSFSTTGHKYLQDTGGGNVALNWYVASDYIVALDEPASVDRAGSLNVGYATGTPALNFGQLLSTKDAYLAISTGNVGIGTINPQAKLDVLGTASSTNLFVNGSSTLQNFTFLNGTGTSATTTNFFSTNFGATNLYTSLTQGSVAFAGAGGLLSQNNANFFWDNTNNRLGIGTTTPPTKLYVAGGDIGLDPNQKIKFNYGDTTRYIGYRSTGIQTGLDIQGDANGPATFANAGLALGSYGGGGTSIPSNGLIVSGNVGIGTTTSSTALTAAGIIRAAATVTGGNAVFSAFQSGVNEWSFGQKGSNSAFVINNGGNLAGTDVITALIGGNVGIGISPSYKLEVNGTASTTNLLSTNITTFGSTTLQNFTFLNGTGTSATTTNFFSTNFGATNLYTSLTQGSVAFAGAGGLLSQNNANFFWDNTNARLGIGTTTPGAPLDVVGTFGNTGNIFNVSSTTASGVVSSYFNVNAIGGVTAYGTILSNAYLQSGGTGRGLDGRLYAITSGGVTNALINANGLSYLNGGSVGIGTTTPGTGSAGSRLDVVGGNIGLDANYLIGQGLGYAGAGGAASFSTLQLYSGSTGATTLNNQGFNIKLQTAGADRLVITNAGLVGIGTSTPAENLTVNGSILFGNTTSVTGTANAFNSGRLGTYNSGVAPFSQYQFIQPANGKALAIWNAASGLVAAFGATGSNSDARTYLNGPVGIGTTTPQSALSVSGDISGFAINANGNGSPKSVQLVTNGLASPVSARLQYGTDGTGWQFRIAKNTAGTIVDQLTVQDNGNVGIGSTTPGEKLEVVGNIIFPNTNSIKSYNASGVSSSLLQVNASNNLMIGDLSNQLNDIQFSVNGSGAGNVVIQRTTGNVGIGTVTPQYPLSVPITTGIIGAYSDATHYGKITPYDGNGYMTFDHLWNTNSGGYKFQNGGADLVAILGTGNVGIGTSTPGSKLEIYGSGQVLGSGAANITDAGARGDMISLISNNTAAGTGGALLFGNTQSEAVGSVGFAAIKGMLTNGSGNTRGDLAFSTRINGLDTNLTEAMRITNTGNVGIGTTNPQAKLDVLGTASSTNLFVAASSTLQNFTFLNATGTNATTTNFAYTGNLSTPFTQGSVVFAGAGGLLSQNNANLFWDNTNARLGIGETVPTQSITITKNANAGNIIQINNNNAGLAAYGALQVFNGAYTSYFGNDGTNTGTIRQNRAFMMSDSPDGASLQAINGTGIITMYTGGNAEVNRRLTILSGGNVGIGTSAPIVQLSNTSANILDASAGGLSGSGGAIGWLTTAAGYGFGLSNSSSAVGANGILIKTAATDSGSFIAKFESGGVNRMALSANGNVGINETAPKSILDIASTTVAAAYSATNFGTWSTVNIFGNDDAVTGTARGIQFQGSKGTTGAGIVGVAGNTTGGIMGLGFLVSNSNTYNEAMRITESGNVGIGTTTPDAPLVVSRNRGNGSTYVQEYLDAQTLSTSVAGSGLVTGYSTNNGTYYYGAVGGYANGNSGGLGLWGKPTVTAGVVSGAPNIYIANGGNVGIGTTTPDYPLTVASNSANLVDFNRGTSQVGALSASNNDFGVYALAGGGGTGILRLGSVGTTQASILANGNFGIGTTTPNLKLDVQGSASAGSFSQTAIGLSNIYTSNASVRNWALATDENAYGTFAIKTSNVIGGNPITAGTVRLLIDGSGNVGIGTTNPQAKLDVLGTASSTNLFVAASSTLQNFTFLNATGTSATTTNLAYTGSLMTPFTQGSVVFAGAGGLLSQNNANLNWNNSTNLLTILGNASTTQIGSTGSAYFATSAGNVGIGTAAPGSTLDVETTDSGVGTQTIVATFGRKGAAVSGTSRESGIVFSDANNGPTFTGGITGIRPNSSADWTGGLGFYVAPGGGSAVSFANLNRAMTILANGNVGIGTTAPEGKLHIISSAYTTGLIIGEAGSVAKQLLIGYDTTNNYGVIQAVHQNTGYKPLILNPSGGNVGIGTVNPQTKLDVQGTASTTALLVGDGTAGAPSIAFASQTTTGFYRVGSAKITLGTGNIFQVNDGTQAAPSLSFNNDSSMGLYRAAPGKLGITNNNTLGIILDSTGNVGIGSSSPFAQLSVSGANQSTQSFNTNGSLGATLALNDTGNTANAGGAVMFGAGNFNFAAIKGLLTNGANNGQGDIQFLTRPVSTDSTLTNAFIIKAAGNVGVGTTTPASYITGSSVGVFDITGASNPALVIHGTGGTGPQEIHITDNNSAGAYFDVAGATTATNNFLSFRMGNTNSSYSIAEAMRITSAGNVGIGMTTPDAKLGILKDGTLTDETSYAIKLRPANGSGQISLLLGPVSAYNAGVIQTVNTGTTWGTNLSLQPNGGNVGIGTTSPVGLFNLYSPSVSNPAFTITAPASVNGQGGTINFSHVGTDSTVRSQIKSSLENIFTNYTTSLIFSTTNTSNVLTEAMRVNSSGNLGIGTTTPAQRLDVYSTNTLAGVFGSNNGAVGLGGNSGYGLIQAYTSDSGAASANLVLQLNGGSNVGIGTTTPARKLTVRDASSNFPLQIDGAGSSVIVASKAGTPKSTFGYYDTGTNPEFGIGTGDGSTVHMFVNTSGNVGINTTNPGTKLSVNGVIGVGADEIPIQETNMGFGAAYKVLRLGLDTSSGLNRDLALNVDPTTVAGGNFNGSGEILIGNKSILAPNADSSNWFGVLRATSTSVYLGGSLSSGQMIGDGLVVNGSKIGLGTVSPNEKLSVVSLDNTSGTNIARFYSNNLSQSVGIGFQDIRQVAAATQLNINAGTTGVLNLGNTSTGGTNIGSAGGNTILNQTSGNVGIGTTTPLSKLAVSGGATIGADYNIAAPTNGLLVEGKLAVGTTTTSNATFTLAHTGVAYSILIDRGTTADGGGFGFRTGGVDKWLFGFRSTGDDDFHVFNYPLGNDALTIKNTTGNVGIGNASPGELLSLGSSGKNAVLSFSGSTSGKIILQTSAAAGTYTLTLPTAQGGVGTYLKNDGSGNLSWSSPSSVQVLSNILSYTATTTWTKSSTTTQIIVELWGGGGGGGGGGSQTSGGSGLDGTSGTVAKFGGFATTTGGVYGGGGSYNPFNVGVGGAGGTGSGGDFNYSGSGGFTGGSGTSVGVGGNSHVGLNSTSVGGSASSVGRGGNGGQGEVSTGSYAGGGGGGGGYAMKTFVGPAIPSSASVNGGSAGSGGASGGVGAGAGTAGVAGAAYIYEYTSVSTGADLAENYPVNDATIEAGDIVAIDGVTPIYVGKADNKAKRPLAGVISTNPGLLLQDADSAGTAGTKPVALAGRIPTKVNFEGGPIQIGDRIALSSVSGVGKKANMFEDSVGVALESFNDPINQGKIKTLINIQSGVDIASIGNALLTYTSASSTDASSTDASSTNPFNFVDSISTSVLSKLNSATDNISQFTRSIINSLANLGINITNNGNVGIGFATSTSALNKLAVAGGVSIGADFNVLAPENGLIVQGNVGIGTTTPNAQLTVNGRVTFYGLSTTNVGDKSLCLSDSGEVTAGDVCGNASSTQSMFSFMDYASTTFATTTSQLASIQTRLSTLENLMASSTGFSVTASTSPNVITDTLTAMGASIVDNITHFKDVAMQSLSTYALTVGKPEKPAGITIYDQINGAPYCLKVVSGQQVTTAGDCNNQPTVPVNQIIYPSDGSSNPPTVVSGTTGSTTPSTTGSTTPSTTPTTVVDNSTSTPPATVDTGTSTPPTN